MCRLACKAETTNMDAAPKATPGREEDDDFIGDRIGLQKVILAGLTIAVIGAYVRPSARFSLYRRFPCSY